VEVQDPQRLFDAEFGQVVLECRKHGSLHDCSTGILASAGKGSPQSMQLPTSTVIESVWPVVPKLRGESRWRIWS